MGTLNPKGVEGVGTLNPKGVEGVGTLELLNPRFEGVGTLNPKRVDKNPKGLIKDDTLTLGGLIKTLKG